MPYRRITFKPGVDVVLSPSAAEGTWSESNLVRFPREGKFEKQLGWTRICQTALTGICRTLHFWSDLSRQAWLACGTHSKLQLLYQGTLHDVTPAAWPPGLVSTQGSQLLQIWSLDNFGEFLIAIPSGGGVYLWKPSQINGGKATLIAGAPTVNQGGFVAMPQQMVVAYGSSFAGVFDPLILRWSDQSDYTVWEASATNQAGSFRLSRGSRIVGAIQGPIGAFVWTDIDIWAMQYQGFPLVWGILQVGSNCGLLAERAAAVLGDTVYWMSDHGFFQLGPGGLNSIPCSVWDVVYRNLDLSNADKCIAATNYHYNEISWFFPSESGGSGEIDSYVRYNVLDKVWDYGTVDSGKHPTLLASTAWTDQNRPGNPYSVDLNGMIQEHDIGVDADGQAMTGVFLQSGYFDLADGQDIMFVDQFIPDFLWDGDNPSLQITLYFRNWPGETASTEGPFTVTPTTKYISFRTRAREIAMRVSCDAKGSFFREGIMRIRSTAAGRL